MYWQAVTVLEARQYLLQIDVSSFPHMTKDGQEKIHRNLHTMAYPERYETPRSMTESEVQRMLAGV